MCQNTSFKSASLGVVIAAAATIVIFYLRAPQAIEQPQFWGEDGNIFFTQQFLNGIEVVFSPYQGYLVLYQRIGALFASHFSIKYAPTIFVSFWIMAAVWAAATIASCNVKHAWLYGAVLMTAPHGGPIFGSLTNAQWILAPALAFVLASPAPLSRTAMINQACFVAISGLTGPFSILTIPIIIWRFLERREPFEILLTTIGGASAAVQLAVLLNSPDRAGMPPVSSEWLSGLLMADRWIGQLVHGQTTSTWTSGALVCLLLAAVAVTIWGEKRRAPYLLLLLFAVLIVAGGWYKYRHSPYAFGLLRGGDRYFFVPRLIVIWILVRGLLQVQWTSVLPAGALCSVALNYTMWSKPILPILDWSTAAAKIERGEAVHFPINPITQPVMWHVTIPARSTHAPQLRRPSQQP